MKISDCCNLVVNGIISLTEEYFIYLLAVLLELSVTAVSHFHVIVSKLSLHNSILIL